ncbi:MAG: DUF5331 domain-containing protein [Scytonema sp. RU_4_4]|nr:DUF5331 domain-containing protein [Scytonema sp. RU_4_4]NJR76891.1 DUF5331 domain-containing protein [Scytonema sp. CRU_2_7]
MNIQQLRQSLKLKWVSYYYNNRSWLVKTRVWGTYDGERRPNSGFILATLSVLEPQLEEVLPFILELNNDPDQIVVALGLNFNPEEHLHLVESVDSVAESELNCESALQTLPDHQPVTPSFVTVEKENNNQPVPSIAVTSAVPFQTLSECKHLTFATTASEEKSLSQCVQAVEVASTQMDSYSMPLMTVTSTQLEGKSQFIPLVAFFSTKFENKSQSVPSVDLATQLENKSKHRSLLAVAISDGESKSRLVSSAAVIASEVESKAVSSVGLATKMESKGRLVTTPQKDAHNQVNPPPASTSHLVNWIDDFCQGVEWDREETRFIP